ncbi:acyl carrier protein phosphodiesterase [Orbus hercynius]|uniref:Acyl carrier protein phosphodiesterase n=1 Tax=Orbus hercynius TaxID=593135 RepID=A0A495RIK9_9GAMM|nr:ACP phosphodiesterase [Orbus hercynius]RKS87372.1 acyl carrier protein phosphodiesterase [Orbus hercynius]
MNILAHLHLASLASSSISGNAVADFIKGDPYLRYDHTIADGVMMHRRLDKLVDELPAIKAAKNFFRPEVKRVAPITLDIVWDHFLSKHWQCYADCQLAQFNASMKVIIDEDISTLPDEFAHFMHHLWQEKWLIRYGEVDFIARVLNGMANRRPKLVALGDTFVDFKQNYRQLEQVFGDFYPQLMEKAINHCL